MLKHCRSDILARGHLSLLHRVILDTLAHQITVYRAYIVFIHAKHV